MSHGSCPDSTTRGCGEDDELIWSQYIRERYTATWGPDWRSRSTIEIPKSKVDLIRVQGWIQRCRTRHGEPCNDRYSDSLAQQCGNLVLVDVIDGCIVDLPNTTTFVALSYVWGSTAMPKLKQTNYHLLKQPGHLFQPQIDGIRVPQVILDAMHLLRAFNERYLWVDSLCVVQDASAEDMERTLRAMAGIYASAEFTIVAAGGSDADHGLRGIGGPSQSRLPDNRIDDTNLALSLHYPSRSLWASRGWTFQESAFARRLLVFDTTVYWLCGRCAWKEIYADRFMHQERWPTNRPHAVTPMGIKSIMTPYPSLQRWGILVDEYSSRNLTYEDDFLRAFAGAMNVIGPTFPGGLIHGLPKFFLDICLLWKPRINLSRRSEGPSWSWTGWKGAVDCYGTWFVADPGLHRKLDLYASWVPNVEMKAVAIYQEGHSNASRPADETGINGFYEYQALRKLPDEMLPAGWTRTEHSNGVYYTHPDTGGDRFRCAYPLPLALGTNTSMSASTHTPLYLICTAPIAMLSLCKPGIRYVSLALKDVVVGNLSVHNIYDEDGSWAQKESACELVALSEAQVQNTAMPPLSMYHDHPAHKKPQGYSYYNVLWVHWVDGIAYRKGVGVVEKEAWDSIGAQVRTFKLG
jgi:hypothetical protein